MAGAFKLGIETENDAFQPSPAREIARILRNVAKRIESGARTGSVVDVNGNVVGGFALGEPSSEADRIIDGLLP